MVLIMALLNMILTVLIILTTCEAAKILGIYHHPGRSHHKLGEVLFKELARRGHEVVMVSPYPLKEPVANYRDIITYETKEDMDDRIKENWFQRFSDESASTKTFFMLFNMTLAQSELLFQNEEFMSLVTSGQKFDLVIMDWLFNESHLIFGHLFKCPIILSASCGTTFNINYVVGNIAPYSYVPYKYFPFTDKMSFYQRTMNVILHTFSELTVYYNNKNHQDILTKYVPNSPSINELLDNVAIILSNGHFSYETVRPTVPNVIDVGGYHVQEANYLPKDLQEYLDAAKDGFIYFSLGSNMQSIFLDKNKQDGILRAFSKIPVRILWKFEDEIKNVPQNIKVAKWLPQNEILAHPNIKMFITHGGLLSTIESIHHGVPMIGIPMFGDQNSNVPTGVEAGYALQILPEDISEESFLSAINEILHNAKYTEKAKFHSDLLRDQPSKPLDRAVFWVEHVLKHNGADHLKNGSIRLRWFEYMLLDVFAFIAAVLLLIYVVLRYLLKIMCNLIYRCFSRRCKKSKVDTSKKTK